MNPARKLLRINESNPRSVIQAISAKSGFDLNQNSFSIPETISAEGLAPAVLNEPASVSEIVSSIEVGSEVDCGLPVDVIPIRISPESNPVDDSSADLLENTNESASQIQQLAARLDAYKIELELREAQLDERVKSFDQTTARNQSDLELRISQLEQQSSNVRCQQLHLMQLQTDIVKSHNATREAIESLVLETGDNDNTIASLKQLKYELSGRFDYIARRWEHLAELMQDVRTRNMASQSIDDAVDWTGESS